MEIELLMRYEFFLLYFVFGEIDIEKKMIFLMLLLIK